MPLHLTKIAFGARNCLDIESWFENRARLSLSTRCCPRRIEELEGGSLYWIHGHALVARNAIVGFEQQPGGRWWIHLEAPLIRVRTTPRRAHQGWRYLDGADAPPDLAPEGEALPARLVAELAKLGLA